MNKKRRLAPVILAIAAALAILGLSVMSGLQKNRGMDQPVIATPTPDPYIEDYAPEAGTEKVFTTLLQTAYTPMRTLMESCFTLSAWR